MHWQAQQHYRRHGRQEGRLCRRQRVLMRYTAGTGLTNQQYCHVAAFALAAATGAELVLPPAAKRDSFGLYFSTKQEENKVREPSLPFRSVARCCIFDLVVQHMLTVHDLQACIYQRVSEHGRTCVSSVARCLGRLQRWTTYSMSSA